MQDTFARALICKIPLLAGRPSVARDDRVSCIQLAHALGQARARRYGILYTRGAGLKLSRRIRQKSKIFPHNMSNLEKHDQLICI